MLKYEIRCFTVKFSKDLAKAKKSKQYFLENKLNLNCDKNSAGYINCKNQLEEIYDDIAEDLKVRSKWKWYEEGEKLAEFVLHLGKAKATQGTVQKLEIDNKEKDDSVETNRELESFLKIYLKGNEEKRNMCTMNSLEIFHYRP